MKTLKNIVSIALLIGITCFTGCKDKELSPAEQFAEDIRNIEEYIADNNIQNVETTANGLHYAITTQGSGSNAPVGSEVTVHYTGTLLDGTKFDSSFDRNQPIKFSLGVGQVIVGWDEGLQNFNVGSKGILMIPSILAYGTRGVGSIGPNEVLIFTVEMVAIN